MTAEAVSERSVAAPKRRVTKFGSKRGNARVDRTRLLVVALGLVLVALAAASYALWQRVRETLQDRPEYQVAIADAWVTPPPAWVGPNLLQEVAAQGDLPATLSILDPALAKRVAAAFGRHPWVEQVEQVRVISPQRMEVRLRYRQPVAVVEVGKRTWPIDAAATVLPDLGPEWELPVIRGGQGNPLYRPGRVWDEPLIAGGAKIAAVLGADWKSLNLQAIEGVLWKPGSGPAGATVQNAAVPQGPSASEGMYYLFSKGGTRVFWGRPPDTQHPGEISADEKLARLKEYVTRHGSLERPNGPYELDIRHWKELTLRPRGTTAE